MAKTRTVWLLSVSTVQSQQYIPWSSRTIFVLKVSNMDVKMPKISSTTLRARKSLWLKVLRPRLKTFRLCGVRKSFLSEKASSPTYTDGKHVTSEPSGWCAPFMRRYWLSDASICPSVNVVTTDSMFNGFLRPFCDNPARLRACNRNTVTHWYAKYWHIFVASVLTDGFFWFRSSSFLPH